MVRASSLARRSRSSRPRASAGVGQEPGDAGGAEVEAGRTGSGFAGQLVGHPGGGGAEGLRGGAPRRGARWAELGQVAGRPDELGQEQAHAAGAGLDGDGVERGGRCAGRPEVAGGAGAHGVEQPAGEVDDHQRPPAPRCRLAVGGRGLGTSKDPPRPGAVWLPSPRRAVRTAAGLERSAGRGAMAPRAMAARAASTAPAATWASSQAARRAGSVQVSSAPAGKKGSAPVAR